MAAFTSAALMAVAIGGQVYQGVKSRQEARKANRAAKKAENLQARKARTQAFRQSRIAQAQVQGAAAGMGAVSSSSGVQGQTGAIATNTNSNVLLANQLDQLRNRQLKAQQGMADAEFVGNMAQLPAAAYSGYQSFQTNAALKSK